MSKKGFSLIELLVVIAIMAIILAISVPMYSRWIAKNRVESDTKKIFNALNEARTKSFVQKEECGVNFPSDPFKTFTIKCDNNSIGTEQVKYNFSYALSNSCSGTLSFFSDGTTNCKGSIHITGNSYGATVDCVKVSELRIATGRWDEDAKQCISNQ